MISTLLITYLAVFEYTAVFPAKYLLKKVGKAAGWIIIALVVLAGYDSFFRGLHGIGLNLPISNLFSRITSFLFAWTSTADKGIIMTVATWIITPIMAGPALILCGMSRFAEIILAVGLIGYIRHKDDVASPVEIKTPFFKKEETDKEPAHYERPKNEWNPEWDKILTTKENNNGHNTTHLGTATSEPVTYIDSTRPIERRRGRMSLDL